MYFSDRNDAGEQLAEALQEYSHEDSVVYALPRGGVVLGAIVAQEISAPLDILAPRKVGHPDHPEYAIGAISEGNVIMSDDTGLNNIDNDWLKAELDRQKAEAKRRRDLYRGDKRPVSVKDKTAIIVDDGIATGMTMRAAIDELRLKDPARIVIAVPVAPASTVEYIKPEVDEVVVLVIPKPFAGSIGAYYQVFDQVEDTEVMKLMQEMTLHGA